jgi:hypothetical protein
MTKLVVDANLRGQLRDFREALELCDETGRVLGRLIPATDPSQWEPLTPEASDEELDRRDQEEESYSTAEVLAQLEKHGCSESGGSDPR